MGSRFQPVLVGSRSHLGNPDVLHRRKVQVWSANNRVRGDKNRRNFGKCGFQTNHNEDHEFDLWYWREINRFWVFKPQDLNLKDLRSKMIPVNIYIYIHSFCVYTFQIICNTHMSNMSTCHIIWVYCTYIQILCMHPWTLGCIFQMNGISCASFRYILIWHWKNTPMCIHVLSWGFHWTDQLSILTKPHL